MKIKNISHRKYLLTGPKDKKGVAQVIHLMPGLCAEVPDAVAVAHLDAYKQDFAIANEGPATVPAEIREKVEKEKAAAKAASEKADEAKTAAVATAQAEKSAADKKLSAAKAS